MSRTARWSVFCVVFAGVAGASVPVAHSEQVHLQLVLMLNSPRQLIEIPDERGRLRLARFEATARVYQDGQARGGALLEQGNENYEFTFERAELVAEADVVQRLTLWGRGLKISGSKEQEFDFVAQVTPSAAGPDIIDYDLEDGFVYVKPTFEAEGTMDVVAATGAS